MTTPEHLCVTTSYRPALLGLRRGIFFSSILFLTSLACWVMADILWRGGMTPLEWVLLFLFLPLFALVTFGFMQATVGFIMILKGDPVNVARFTPAEAVPDPASVTALVFPVCNEDVSRVYEGLRTMYLDLTRRGFIKQFDCFILSDSADANKWIEEEVSWVELCKQLKGFGKIFYRKRVLSLNKKSGNISDFCRRWGKRYRYMVILDADSLMDADTINRLVAMMDANPATGIIQTAPQLTGGTTFFARLIQFSSAVYGPAFVAGMNFWQMSEGNYWGHNAIIRLHPFIEHCALPAIPGARKHARFLSHDYVEAALMRKAGYAVWLAAGLPGSFEGVPPTFIDNAKRDRRWCRGNLQHSWLLFSRGLHGINKLHLTLGIMSYLSCLLWFLFLILGTIHASQEVQREAFRRFDHDVGLTSFLDIGGIRLAFGLFVVTVIMLLAPKLYGLLLAVFRPSLRLGFGGVARIVAGIALEQCLSMLMAPVQMLFNTQAVIGTWLGQEVSWLGQKRTGQRGASWQEAILTHASHTVIGCAWAIIAYSIRSDFFWWLAPIWISLICSVPLSVVLGSEALGDWFRRLGIFLTPYESHPPAVISHLQKNIAECRKHFPPPQPLRANYGLMRIVLDPYLNAAHAGILKRSSRTQRISEPFENLQTRLLKNGPETLTAREKQALMNHQPSVVALHKRLWLTPDEELSPWWRMAMRHYNTLTAAPASALYR